MSSRECSPALGSFSSSKQIPHALGYDHSWEGELEFFQRDGHNTFSEIRYAFSALSPGAIIITIVSLTVLIVWQSESFKRTRVAKALPAPLVVVLLGVVINGIFGMVAPRLALALVASIETLLSVEATDNLDPEKRVTPTNLELKAQGLGNIVAGLCGGIPLTQVIVRSSANVDSGGKTRFASFVHGVLLLTCVAAIPSLLNEIPLACLAAILLVIGYRLARISLFKSMWREGFWQFVPFIVTIVALVFTDLLKGITLGMIVAFFEILIYNYQLNFYREETKPGCFAIRLTEHMTFLNKAALKRILREVPPGCTLTIDMTGTRILDHDVREVIEDFKTHAEADGIRLTVKGAAGPKIALTAGA